MGITIGVGILGAIIDKVKPGATISVIGFIAGADITLWFYEITLLLIVVVARLSEQVAFGIVLILLLIGAMLGLLLIRKYRDEFLIFVTMLVGVQFNRDGFRFDSKSNLTAIIIIALALLGGLVQFADYLREMEAKSPLIGSQQTASSLDFLQSLEIDEE